MDVWRRMGGKQDLWAGKKVTTDELFTVVSAEVQGKRAAMEDFFTADVTSFASPHCALLGVYDGHFGARCSSFVSQTLPVVISKHPFLHNEPLETLRSAFLTVDAKWIAKAKAESPNAPYQDGSTALVIFVKNNELHVASVGDCRAILCRKGKAFALTRDHRPDSPREAERIQRNGGSVVGGRLQGKLAVSRSIGDLSFKESKVLISDPDIATTPLDGDCEYVLAACDGLFEEMTNEQAVEFINKLRQQKKPWQEIAQALADEAVELGSTDNVTVVILAFEQKSRKLFQLAEKVDNKSKKSDETKTPNKLARTLDIPRELQIPPKRARRMSDGRSHPPRTGSADAENGTVTRSSGTPPELTRRPAQYLRRSRSSGMVTPTRRSEQEARHCEPITSEAPPRPTNSAPRDIPPNSAQKKLEAEKEKEREKADVRKRSKPSSSPKR